MSQDKVYRLLLDSQLAGLAVCAVALIVVAVYATITREK